MSSEFQSGWKNFWGVLNNTYKCRQSICSLYMFIWMYNCCQILVQYNSHYPKTWSVWFMCLNSFCSWAVLRWELIHQLQLPKCAKCFIATSDFVATGFLQCNQLFMLLGWWTRKATTVWETRCEACALCRAQGNLILGLWRGRKAHQYHFFCTPAAVSDISVCWDRILFLKSSVWSLKSSMFTVSA